MNDSWSGESPHCRLASVCPEMRCCGVFSVCEGTNLVLKMDGRAQKCGKSQRLASMAQACTVSAAVTQRRGVRSDWAACVRPDEDSWPLRPARLDGR